MTSVDHHRTDEIASKNALRRSIIAARRSRPAGDRSSAAQANDAHLTALLSGSAVVCGYLPLATEPLTTGLLDRLVAGGTDVLVPVVIADSPLDWCRYPVPTVASSFGIAEPRGPRLGPGMARTADAILVPAFAVDPAGRRLGRGGGHYDRTLALLAGVTTSVPGGQRLVAVLFDGEFIDEVPAEPHDKLVNAAVSPTPGIVHLPR